MTPLGPLRLLPHVRAAEGQTETRRFSEGEWRYGEIRVQISGFCANLDLRRREEAAMVRGKKKRLFSNQN